MKCQFAIRNQMHVSELVGGGHRPVLPGPSLPLPHPLLVPSLLSFSSPLFLLPHLPFGMFPLFFPFLLTFSSGH